MAIKVGDIITHFSRTTDQFLSEAEFKSRLRAGRQLRIKHSLDTRTPVLHIGHAVNLWLLRYMQDLGHKVILVFSDFTALMGDLDGRLESNAVTPEDEIQRNIREFIFQAQTILRFDDPNLIEIRRNSEWYGHMSIRDLLDILSLVTHARLVNRDMFQMRIAEKREIYMHEMLAPILQGYDSLAVESDLTVIGSDQFFNESIGRFLQEKHRRPPQALIVTKVTAGTDGRKKQVKEFGNYIGLNHSPRDKFGRVMSIPDELIDEYFRVYTDVPLEAVDRLRDVAARHPREAKLALARAIVERYHGPDIARVESEWFERTISKGAIPDDIPVLAVMASRMDLLDLVSMARPGKSRGDTRRLIKQGGIDIDGRRLQDPDEKVSLFTGNILRVGKRTWFRIKVVVLPTLHTSQLSLAPLMVDDIEDVVERLPALEISDYLSRSRRNRAQKAGQKLDNRAALRQELLRPEPRSNWLWTIRKKDDPNTIVGLAHLQRRAGKGSQNIWVMPGFENEVNNYVRECLEVLGDYAFEALGFSSMEFKDAFLTATLPPTLEMLYKSVVRMRSDIIGHDNSFGVWGFTREGWEQMQDLRREKTPSLFVNDKDKRRQKKKPTPDQPDPSKS